MLPKILIWFFYIWMFFFCLFLFIYSFLNGQDEKRAEKRQIQQQRSPAEKKNLPTNYLLGNKQFVLVPWLIRRGQTETSLSSCLPAEIVPGLTWKYLQCKHVVGTEVTDWQRRPGLPQGTHCFCFLSGLLCAAALLADLMFTERWSDVSENGLRAVWKGCLHHCCRAKIIHVISWRTFLEQW